MRYDSLIFDLDGTLWDTCDACAMAWNLVLEREGITYRTIVADDVRVVTGKPHDECIRVTFSDLSEDEIARISAATAIEDTRMIDQRGGLLYEGVADGLFQLHLTHRLFIVSNCQSGYIETFLKLNGFESIFEDFECWGNTGEPKGENLRRVIERNGLKTSIMIGDADGDETAAVACKVPFAFVDYGFGTCESPDMRFSSFPELVRAFES